MRALFAIAACLLLLPATADARKPKEAPAPVAEGPRQVSEKAHLAEAAGVRATVVGELVRHTPEGVEGATEGTAVKLADGTFVFLSKEAPPAPWQWMVGSQVRVQGTLWSSGAEQGGWALPWLADAEAPMPADAGMPVL